MPDLPEKQTRLVDGVTVVTRPARDLWTIDLHTESGAHLRATSDRPDARDALLAIADALRVPGSHKGEPYLIDTLTRQSSPRPAARP